MSVLGVDIGGSSIKGALVDVVTGALVDDDVVEVDTPSPARPTAVAEVVATVVTRLGPTEVVGCTFPGRVRRGVAATAVNLADDWLGLSAVDLFGKRLERSVAVLNDADAAGLAEMTFGAGRDVGDTVVVVTLGTGVGTALFADGVLVPNVELGVLGDIDVGAEARHRLPPEEWRANLEALLDRIDVIVDPGLVILGGGASEHDDLIEPVVAGRAAVVRAHLGNAAGIVGAALHASRTLRP